MSEAVDVFLGGDEVAEFVGLGLVGQGELDDDAMNIGIGIRLDYFFSDRSFAPVVTGLARLCARHNCACPRKRIRVEFDDVNTNIFAIAFFKINIFHNDRVVAVAEDEELRGDAGGLQAGDLVGLALFDKAGELAAIQNLHLLVISTGSCSSQ